MRNVVLLLALFSLVSVSNAIVFHDDNDAADTHPLDNVIGRWNDNATCVVIGKSDWTSTNYIVTTRHQGYGVGSTVIIGGVAYRIKEVFTEPTSADLRICTLKTTTGGDVHLTDFVTWYSGTNERNKSIVMGGFGKARGTSGSDANGPYYLWSGTSNTTERWGDNTVSGTQDDFYVETYYGNFTSDILISDFGSSSDHDCAIADWDSGGGWFINVSGEWQVAGISAYTGALDRSYYYPSAYRNMGGIRLSSYDTWIDATLVPEPATMLVVGAGLVGVMLRRCRRK